MAATPIGFQQLKRKLGRYPNRRERQCLGKSPLPEWFARKEAARLTARDGHPTRAYLCPVCHQWHVGRLKHATQST